MWRCWVTTAAGKVHPGQAFQRQCCCPAAAPCYVNGMNTTDEDKLFDIRQTVGMVFQNPDNQLVATIVEEDVAFGPENLGVPPAEIRQRVDDALRAVGMYELPGACAPSALRRTEAEDRHRRCHRYGAPVHRSGRAHRHAGSPAAAWRCCIPSARLNKKYGITVVLITHYMDEAAQCDRVVVVDDGKILLDGTAREVFSHVEAAAMGCEPGCAPAHRAVPTICAGCGSHPIDRCAPGRRGVRRCPGSPAADVSHGILCSDHKRGRGGIVEPECGPTLDRCQLSMSHSKGYPL